MLGVILALTIVLDPPPTPHPAMFVQQLSSPLFATREAASEALLRLGRPALPSLKAARDSKDAEVRTRSVALVARIEDALILEPTSIPLEFQDVPLSVAVEDLNRRAGSRFTLAPDEIHNPDLRRITARSPEPVPFWKAFDLLCSAGNVHLLRDDPEAQGVTDDAVLLIGGSPPPSSPRSDHGPFRVQLKNFHLENNPSQVIQSRGSPTHPLHTPDFLEGSPPSFRGDRVYTVEFLVSAEPRLSITRNGPVKLTAAVDDLGQPFLQAVGSTGFQRTAGYFGMNPSPMLRLRVDLGSSKVSGRKIRLLQGSIPVVVSMRRPDPLTIPLADATGKTFRSDQVSLTLIEDRPAADNQPSAIRVAIRAIDEGASAPDIGPGAPLQSRSNLGPQQLEVLDENGQVLPWFPTTTLYDGDETRLTMTVSTRVSGPRATTLRYHQTLQVESTIPFEFREVPIP